jgi:hypothetical protein
VKKIIVDLSSIVYRHYFFLFVEDRRLARSTAAFGRMTDGVEFEDFQKPPLFHKKASSVSFVIRGKIRTPSYARLVLLRKMVSALLSFEGGGDTEAEIHYHQPQRPQHTSTITVRQGQHY